MDSLASYIVQNFELISTIIGSPILVALGARFWGIFQLRRVYQVTHPEDPALSVIEAIQAKTFPAEECDPPGFLANKIEESRFDMFGRPRSDNFMVALYYRKRGGYHGYLTAEYNVETKSIFFWYLVNSVPQQPDALSEGGTHAAAKARQYDKEVATKLIKKLSRICNNNGGPWRQIIAEVDATKYKDAALRLHLFRQYGKSLRRKRPLTWILSRLPGAKSLPSQVFKVDIPFKMPLHDPGHLFEAEKHETVAWLVMATQKESDAKDASGAAVIDCERVRAMFDTLASSYHDENEPRYNEYIARFYEDLILNVPQKVGLISGQSELGDKDRRTRLMGQLADARTAF